MGDERSVRETAARCRNALDQAGQALAAMRTQARQWNALAAQAAEHKDRADALAEELAQRDASAEGLKGRTAELEDALQAAEARIASLEADLEEAHREIRALQSRRKEDQQILQRLRSALGDAESMAASVFGMAAEGAPAAAGEDPVAGGKPDGAEEPDGTSAAPLPRKAQRPRMGEWLYDTGRLTQSKLDMALEVQRGSHERLGRILVRMGAVSDADVAQCLARQYGIPFERLNGSFTPSPEALAALPARAARAHSCLPMRLAGGALAVAMANPQDLVALDEIRRLSGREVTIAAAPQDAVLEAIERCYPPHA